MKINRKGEKWSWMNFKYEQLNTFCFVCGILSHLERDYNPYKEIERTYGVWLGTLHVMLSLMHEEDG